MHLTPVLCCQLNHGQNREAGRRGYSGRQQIGRMPRWGAAAEGLAKMERRKQRRYNEKATRVERANVPQVVLPIEAAAAPAEAAPAEAAPAPAEAVHVTPGVPPTNNVDTHSVPPPPPTGEAAPAARAAAEEAAAAGEAAVDSAAPTKGLRPGGGLPVLKLPKIYIVSVGANTGTVPKEMVFSHMARPSKKPSAKDLDACATRDAPGGAAKAPAGGYQGVCCMGANVGSSKGGVVEVSWGKAKKRRKYDATVRAVDHSKGAQPMHAQFWASGNAWRQQVWRGTRMPLLHAKARQDGWLQR